MAYDTRTYIHMVSIHNGLLMPELTKFVKAGYAATAGILQSHVRFGKNIYEDDWDLLIVLDACRVDALQQVQDEYEFINSIQERWSLGSTSKEWMENTFVNSFTEEISSTVYLTANTYSEHLRNRKGRRVEYTATQDTPVEGSSVLSGLVKGDLAHPSEFCDIIELWKMVDKDDSMSKLHPSKVTDCAIRTAKDTNCDRMIVHYMQPHRPYLPSDEADPWTRQPFGYLNSGGDFDNVWEAYLDNLRLALDYVELLLENNSSDKVVITSDHGELFGEWGLYCHEVGIPHPAIRKVPWVETTAEDLGTRDPEPVITNQTASESTINERLEALGYK